MSGLFQALTPSNRAIALLQSFLDRDWHRGSLVLDCEDCLAIEGVIAATTCAREPFADLETRALSMLSDDQAMASFIRWQTAMHGAKAIASLRTALGVEACVDAIYEKAQ